MTSLFRTAPSRPPGRLPARPPAAGRLGAGRRAAGSRHRAGQALDGCQPERGFTLLEALAAIALLAIGLSALLGGASTGLRSLARAEAESLATLQAQSLLAAIGPEQPLDEGMVEGRFENGSRWVLRVAALDAVAPPPHALVLPRTVEVTVSWEEAGRPRTLSLSTLRLVPAR